MAKLDHLKDDKSNISRFTGILMIKSIPKTLGTGSPELNVVISGTKKEKWAG
jgi:hypothetical protein